MKKAPSVRRLAVTILLARVLVLAGCLVDDKSVSKVVARDGSDDGNVESLPKSPPSSLEKDCVIT